MWDCCLVPEVVWPSLERNLSTGTVIQRFEVEDAVAVGMERLEQELGDQGLLRGHHQPHLVR